jgi:outer membrane receptor protein involved in Fe transport
MRESGRMSRRAPAANATSLSACVAGVLAAAQASALTPADSSDVQEIIVTAIRRSESVLDVPYNISAIRARRIFLQHGTRVGRPRSRDNKSRRGCRDE